MITINVWVVEDDSNYRRMLQRLLNSEEHISCERVFPSCPKLLAAIETESPPDLVLMDLGLPQMDGVEGIRRIKSISPDVSVLVLTVFKEKKKVLEALNAGAMGFLLKTAEPKMIISSVNEIFMGGAALSPTAAKMLIEEMHKPKPSEQFNLSERENEVLHLLADGLLVKEMADKLGISRRTCAFHLNNIYQKLKVKSQSGAIAKAFRSGIL
jgi:DNA-binding NarL/FixJ family response regulator